MPSLSAYYVDVPRNKSLKQVVAENVRAVMVAKKLRQQNVAALAKLKGHEIDQTTVGRIARAAIPTTLDRLDALAAGLSVEPWHLLVADLDPAKLPKLGTESTPASGEKVVAAHGLPPGHPQVARLKAGPRMQEPRAQYNKIKKTAR